tara:strand:- start:1803 stop:2324 length:522 start_codon:yes stop_codon:yes gene_type:complete
MAIRGTTRRMIRGAAPTAGLSFRVKRVEFPHLKHLKRKTDVIGSEILMFAAFALQKRVRIMLSKPGTGKQYPGLRYRSAQRFKPPAVQTGDLRNSFVAGSRSVGTTRKIQGGMAINFRQATINASKVYGPKLEKTHPFFKPSINRMRNDRTLEKIANRWIKKAIRKCNQEFKT